MECAYDNGKAIAGKSTSIIYGSGKLNIKYVLAILNSKLISFWYKVIYRSLALAGGYIRIGHNDLGTIPIPEVLFENQKPFIYLANKILADKLGNPQADMSELVVQIDRLVYELYGLTEAEIAIVEGR